MSCYCEPKYRRLLILTESLEKFKEFRKLVWANKDLDIFEHRIKMVKSWMDTNSLTGYSNFLITLDDYKNNPTLLEAYNILTVYRGEKYAVEDITNNYDITNLPWSFK